MVIVINPYCNHLLQILLLQYVRAKLDLMASEFYFWQPIFMSNLTKSQVVKIVTLHHLSPERVTYIKRGGNCKEQ